MILDKIENLALYQTLLPCLEEGLAAVRALGSDPEVGRYEFEGGFFMVQEGDTRPVEDGDYEAHRKYLDVQLVLSGKELVVWEDKKELQTSQEYDGEKDKEMFSGKAGCAFVVEAGMCWIAFPHDCHKACRHQAKPWHYKKVVLKLPVSPDFEKTGE